MNLELRTMLFFTRMLPRLLGSAHIAGLFSKLYMRKPRAKEVVDVLGFRLELEPMEAIDREVMFAPQLFDRREIGYIHRHLPVGGVFLDLGSNIGFYSLVASRIVGESGRVLTVEADPYTFSKVQHTVSENNIENIKVLQVGVADKEQVLQLTLQLRGNRGGCSFMSIDSRNTETVSVQCKPLFELLHENDIQRVDVAKLDLEGFEYRALCTFFAQADRSLWPRHLIVERADPSATNPTIDPVMVGGDVNELIAAHGYTMRLQHGMNYIWELL